MYIRQQSASRNLHASILLEVVLALALFLGAATVISTGITASVQAVHRLRLNTHAANLAISLMSEMQMHARPILSVGPETFEPPFEQWTYRIVVQPSEAALEAEGLQTVEVIVSHNEENIVHRLTQLLRTADVHLSGRNSEEAFPTEL